MAKTLILSLTKPDFVFETFRSGGPGGQNQNKRDTGVRMKHPPSGAVAESREHRSQLQNKKAAFERLTQSPEFQNWCKLQASAQQSSEPAKLVDVLAELDEMMAEKNLKIEYGEKVVLGPNDVICGTLGISRRRKRNG